MKNIELSWSLIILILLLGIGVLYIGSKIGEGEAQDWLKNLLPTEPPEARREAIEKISLHVGADEVENMRCNIGLIIDAEGAGPFEGIAASIHVKYKGTDQVTSKGGELDASGSFSWRYSFLIPGYYELWAECGGFKTDPFKLEIRGVVVDVPERHSRADTWMYLKLYANRIGEYKIYKAKDGDWENNEIYFFTMSVNKGGYGEKRIWYRPATGIYWYDARLKSDPSYSAIYWGASDFVEVVP